MKDKKKNLESPEDEVLEIQEGNQQEDIKKTEDLETGEAIQLDELEKELPQGNQLENLQSSLEEMTAKAEEYLDGWQRSRAEFANYKKRILKENTEIRQIARGEVIKIFLDIVDDLERALQDRPEENSEEAWAEGIDIICQKLKTRLNSEGIRPMNALGEEFNPNIHEALMTEESEEYESGIIIEVMQEGYWIGDKVLRPALVRVAA